MMEMMEMDDYYQDIDKLENRGRSDGKPVSINDDLSLQNTTNTSTASDRITVDGIIKGYGQQREKNQHKEFSIVLFPFTLFRLKQMEEEFYKFVSPAEIAKDLNLPKELATKIHKYWSLKRKVYL